MNMNTAAERAERLLAHYMLIVWERAGLTWSEDNDAEIGLVIDNLMEAVDDAIRAHREDEPHFYADGSSS